MCYLHNVSGILTFDINILTLMQRKTSSVINMWAVVASTKKEYYHNINVTNTFMSNTSCLIQNDNER